MLTIMPPSSLWQRTKRSPNTRTSSFRILKPNAFAYHSAVFRGSGAFRWMWLIRYAMRVVLLLEVRESPSRHPRPRRSGKSIRGSRAASSWRVRGSWLLTVSEGMLAVNVHEWARVPVGFRGAVPFPLRYYVRQVRSSLGALPHET